MIDRLIIIMASRPWIWKVRAWLKKTTFFFDSRMYRLRASATKAEANSRIFGSFAWIGIKSLFWVVLGLIALMYLESYLGDNFSFLSPLHKSERDFNIDQLRLYAQLLTAIFSIYFATIGIILSAGYTRLRRDIIQMLTNEQVGSVYSRILVLAAMFCLTATASPSLGFEPGLLVYAVGTGLTILSALALFPLGQRLFNFFDFSALIQSEILPNIVRHIEEAAKPRKSISLANYHFRAARHALGQLSYLDDEIKKDRERLQEKLPEQSDNFSYLLLLYLPQKNTINQNSYWFPRRPTHKQWFFAGDTATSMALKTSSQQVLVEEKPDHQWFENEIIKRLSDHAELAFGVGDLNLALKIISRFSIRLSSYAHQFQFEIGMQEVKRFKEIVEQAFASPDADTVEDLTRVKIGIADTWAALGSNLCLEVLRRIITFEKELEKFFEADQWDKRSLRRLPAFLQMDLALVTERIEFERKIEGRRLSQPKYVQQLAVQKLLQHYSKALPEVCEFYCEVVPDFVASLAKLKMYEAATQVVLASLHSHWKLPGWFDQLAQVLERYRLYQHYSEQHYALPEIDIAEMVRQLDSARTAAIAMLGKADMVRHIFDNRHSDDFPDHFGQIYFELAEACISALENNDENKLEKVFPMFLSLAFLAADSKFSDPSLEISEEFRLHLISTVINDMASVLGYAILYAEHFENENLSRSAIAKFDAWTERAADMQLYFKRMLLLSNSHNFSVMASPRSLIRTNWKVSFEQRMRHDGFSDEFLMTGGRAHPSPIVREFMRSHADASHLFFAQTVFPQLGKVDFEVDRNIIDLVDQLSGPDEEGQHEDL